MGDDGAGLEAVRGLREAYLLPAGADVFEGGTLGLGLLDRLDGCDQVLVADCAAWGGEPGEVVRLGQGEVEAVFSRCLSPHELGFNDLLAALELLGRRPQRLTVIGIEPQRVDLGLGLSEAVRRGLPEMVEALVRELRLWGVAPLRKGAPSAAAPADPGGSLRPVEGSAADHRAGRAPAR
jgi:hydrogenase maturation protease